MLKIAIIGDIHRHFDATDVATFNQSDADLILLTGDLADFRDRDALQVAGHLAQLHKPAILIGGNHDCTSTSQFIAEIKGIDWLAQRDGAGQAQRVHELRQHLGGVIFAGYSCHDFSLKGQDFSLIAARPFSPGGPDIRLRPYIRQQFGIHTFQDSVRRLQELVDAAAHDTLIFLGHNGPTGLGDREDSIWGCDFQPGGGDFGDADLEAAIAYARACGRQVPAVIAGHMHHQLAGGGLRRWLVELSGTTYINAACVPRIFKRASQTVHHHLLLTLDQGQVQVAERFVS